MIRGPCLCVLVALAGCSTVLGIEDLHPPTIHGVVRDMAADTVSRISVAFSRDPGGAQLGDDTTDDHGRFEISFTEGFPVSGVLTLDDPRFVPTYSRLVQPVVDHADLDVEVLTLTSDGLHTLVTGAGFTQDTSRSVVVVQVLDAGGNAVLGATVHAETAEMPEDHVQICYTDLSTGAPCATGATRDDGKAWLFNVPETTSLHITATVAGGHSYAAAMSVPPGPTLSFTPVPPSP